MNNSIQFVQAGVAPLWEDIQNAILLNGLSFSYVSSIKKLLGCENNHSEVIQRGLLSLRQWNSSLGPWSCCSQEVGVLGGWSQGVAQKVKSLTGSACILTSASNLNLSLVLSCAHLCCHCLPLSLSPTLAHPSLMLTHAPHIQRRLSPFPFPCPRHYHDQLTSSYSSAVKNQSEQWQRSSGWRLSFFTWIPSFFVWFFIHTGGSALTMETEVWQHFGLCFVLNWLTDCSVDA